MDLNRRDLLLSGAGVAAVLAAASPSPSQNNPKQAPPGPEAAPQPGTGSPDVSAYAALTNEKSIAVVNLRDLEAEAKKILPAYAYAYISGGAGDEWTLRQNETAFDRWVIEPHFLAGVKTPDLAITVLGSRLSLPVITAPMGGQGMAHALKEIPDVKGTHAAGTLYVNSSVSHLSLEEIAASSPGPKWFQIYFPANRDYARELLGRAKAAGFTAIVVTIDGTTFSNRERTIRLGAVPPNLGPGNGVKTPGIDPRIAGELKTDLDWDDVAFCQKQTGLPVLIKGVLTPAMAIEASKRGCAGVWVSNHGGRAIDHTAAAISALPRIVQAIGGKGVILIDGGIRRGQDVFRALALGANVVALGRPVLYGMALGGAQGVQSVYARLRTELQMVMQLAGTAAVAGITQNYIRLEGQGSPRSDAFERRAGG
jgi:isopentenyl diphosphate isomerase/L-lactate dehydrogenase-like FMN-dependent dehydrogenase